MIIRKPMRKLGMTDLSKESNRHGLGCRRKKKAQPKSPYRLIVDEDGQGGDELEIETTRSFSVHDPDLESLGLVRTIYK